MTDRYGAEFEEASKDLSNIVKIDDWKVIEHSDSYAEVYFYSDFGGCLISFECENGKWKEKGWEATWSDSGSADDFIWPYIR